MATGSQRGVLFSMCLALVLVVGSVSALNLALPELAVDLRATNTDLTWIADGYTVALAALVLPCGALGDRLGRRTVLLAGTAVFGAASLAAAFTHGVGALVACRVVMGAGAALIMPGTLATITAAFPPEQRAKGVATWSGFAAAGAILGLLAAGGLLEPWGWRAIFVATAALAVGVAAAALALAPDTRGGRTGAWDLLGAAALAAAIGGLVFAIIEGSDAGWTHASALAGFAVAVAGAAGYVAIDLRHPVPLLEPRLFGLRGFRVGSLVIVVQFMAVFGFFFVGLQYLQLILGQRPLLAAVALVPVAAVVLPVSQLTPRLAARAGAPLVMTGGLLALAAGFVVIALLHDGSGYLPFLGGLVLAGLGIGLTGSTGTAAITGSLGPGAQGVASAVNDTTREVGSALGIAIMGAAYGSAYRDALPAPPQDLPAAARAAIRDSAAAGLQVADGLGARGAPLAAAVRDAFMRGLSVSLLVVAAIVAVAAVVVWIRAPRAPQP
jgi:MFS family permease